MRRAPMQEMSGVAVSPGIAIGRAVCLGRDSEVLRFQLEDGDIDNEIERLHHALESARREVAKAEARTREVLGEELAGILEAQAMLLGDDLFVQRIAAHIRSESVNAEWAVMRTCEELEAQFARIETDYLKERGEDLRNVGRYLLRSLQGISHHVISEIQGDVVIIADELTPSDALRLARQRVVGFVLERGGKTSHTAIIARGLNLPLVVGLEAITEALSDQAMVVVDGNDGKVILNPTAELIVDYRQREEEGRGRDLRLASISELAAQTVDGFEVELRANLELLDEVDRARRFGCAGVGLFRSEFFYLEKSPALPTEEEMFELFSELLRRMAPQPVVVRTLDLGGRKLAATLLEEREENPVLGLRGIRLTLARPELMRTQIRSLYRAAAFGDLRIMIPMVTTVDESRAFQEVCRQTVAELEAEGLEHRSDVPLGAMIEVPAAALVSRHFAAELDFLSIGTNDLIQYSLAVDRNNEDVAQLYEPAHPAVLSLLKTIADATRSAAPCELSICGEMAADPALTPLLLGLGLNRLSMSPRSIPVIKDRIRQLEYARLREAAERCLQMRRASEVTQYLSTAFPVAES